MSVKGSPNYVWFIAERIGRGAMGNVYVARNRKKGTKFAAKVFSQETKSMSKDYITTELQILEYLPRHDNIIKFIAVEEETYSKDKVLIMELCEGGSVQTILDQPINYYGLDEEEFMLIFEHICAGINHLFRNHVVHRDVKPGNILLYVASDGRHIYKLIDYGASRRLDQDDEGFKSLCGTEEYLHPKMHKAAFIRRIPGQVYDHTVDLWSFAVTLYQCATGKLPFYPKAGIRQDKPMMQRLINDREPDVISQVELADGTIEKRRDLPATCQLSSGVRIKLVEVLRCLLNVHEAVEPSTFFYNIQQFFQRIKVHVFALQERSVLTVFVQPNDTVVQLRAAITAQTGIHGFDQLLLTEDELLENSPLYGEQLQIKEYGETSPEEPLFLVSSPSAAHPKESNPPLPEVPQYETGMNLSSDGKFAKETCGNICYYQRLIQKTLLIQKLMAATERALSLSLFKFCQRIKPLILSQRKLFEFALKSADRAKMRLQNAVDCQCASRAAEELHGVRSRKGNHYEMECDFHKLSEATEGYLREIKRPTKPACASPSRCNDKALKIVNEATPMYQTLKGDVTKELTHNDLEIHKYTRSEIKHGCRRIKEIAEKHCLKEADLKYSKAIEFIGKMTSIRQELLVVESKMKTYDDHVDKFTEMFDIEDRHAQCGRSENVDKTTSISYTEEQNFDTKLGELCLQSSAGEIKNKHLAVEKCDKFQDSGLPKSTSNHSKSTAERERFSIQESQYSSPPASTLDGFGSQVPLLGSSRHSGYAGFENLGFGSDFSMMSDSAHQQSRLYGSFHGARPRVGVVANASQLEQEEGAAQQLDRRKEQHSDLHGALQNIKSDIRKMTDELEKNNFLMEKVDNG